MPSWNPKVLSSMALLPVRITIGIFSNTLLLRSSAQNLRPSPSGSLISRIIRLNVDFVKNF